MKECLILCWNQEFSSQRGNVRWDITSLEATQSLRLGSTFLARIPEETVLDMMEISTIGMKVKWHEHRNEREAK